MKELSERFYVGALIQSVIPGTEVLTITSRDISKNSSYVYNVKTNMFAQILEVTEDELTVLIDNQIRRIYYTSFEHWKIVS